MTWKNPIINLCFILGFFLEYVVIISMINRIRNRSDEIKSRKHTTSMRFFVTHFVRSSRMTPTTSPWNPRPRHPERFLRRVSVVRAEILKQVQDDHFPVTLRCIYPGSLNRGNTFPSKLLLKNKRWDSETSSEWQNRDTETKLAVMHFEKRSNNGENEIWKASPASLS